MRTKENEKTEETLEVYLYPSDLALLLFAASDSQKTKGCTKALGMAMGMMKNARTRLNAAKKEE